MSFGFSVGDFLALAQLAIDLRQSYISAPDEYRSLAADLDAFTGLISQLNQGIQRLNQCSAEQQLQLVMIIGRSTQILNRLGAIRDRFRSFQTQATVWDRLRFPGAEIRVSQANLHLQISALKLFLGSLTIEVLGRILDVLEERSRLDEANWTSLLALLAQRGIGEETVAPYREQLEAHVQAIHEVAESERELSVQSNAQSDGTNPFETDLSDASTIAGDGENSQDGVIGVNHRQRFSIGPPRPNLLRSRICQGALRLQNGISVEIRQRRRGLFSEFAGDLRYKLECLNCCLVGYQSERPNDLIRPTNTPLFFAARQNQLKKTSLEYHLDIHKQNRNKLDGLFYRTIFFWKCHVPAKRETPHDKGEYECPFCPSNISWGNYYNRLGLLEHILTNHVQNQPSEQLRVKFNCWVEDSPAIFESEHGRTRGRGYDLLLPRPYTEIEARYARLARDRENSENAVNVENIGDSAAGGIVVNGDYGGGAGQNGNATQGGNVGQNGSVAQGGNVGQNVNAAQGASAVQNSTATQGQNAAQNVNIGQGENIEQEWWTGGSQPLSTIGVDPPQYSSIWEDLGGLL